MLNSKKEVKMKKKGQAAMEFLMTYGWAILAAIIVIGVLAFYFRPTGLGAGTSRLNQPFYLVDSNVRAGPSQGPNLIIRNDGDDTAVISGFRIVGGTTICTNITTIASIGVGASSPTIVADCLPDLTVGGQFQGNVEINYTMGSGLAQKVTGVIAGEVQ